MECGVGVWVVMGGWTCLGVARVVTCGVGVTRGGDATRLGD